MKTVHQQLLATREDVSGSFEANFFPREIAVHQQALRNVLAVWDELRLLQAEGPIEVTLRSRTTTITLGVNRDMGATIVQDLHEMLSEDAHRLCGQIERLHYQLVTEGESAERIQTLALLLAPIGPDGRALPEPAPAAVTPGPFLAPVTPTPSRPRRRAA